LPWGIGIMIYALDLPIQTKGKQLCGGMVYAAPDFFHGAKNIPVHTAPPAVGTSLNNYSYNRQVSAHILAKSKSSARRCRSGRADVYRAERPFRASSARPGGHR